ncbi:MAG: tetratricopeptide repeat protein [Candidatus Poribacteria bacterium]|nr:tetratricopeptide repeat protein [Candidatus Poribacteria bacterium]
MADKTKHEWVGDGLDLMAERKYHEAVELFEKAVEIDPEFVEAHLAKAYEFMGALDDAINVLRAAIENTPDEPFLHTSLSQCLQKQGKIPEAEDEMAMANQLQSMRR